MTRFDAQAPDERRQLFADAIDAYRERDGPYLTVEVDRSHLQDGVLDPELGVPWIQFADRRCLLDCTDAELDRLHGLVPEYPAFTIDEVKRPEAAEGSNVRIRADADTDRIAQFLDALFRTVYDLPEEYRAWVVEL